MKKFLLIIIGLLIIGTLGFFGYNYYKEYTDNNLYKLTLDSERNQADWRYKNVMSERTQLYVRDGASFHVNMGTFFDKATAAAEITRMIQQQYNPAQINYHGKYVYYDQQTGNFFYQSDNKIISR